MRSAHASSHRELSLFAYVSAWVGGLTAFIFAAVEDPIARFFLVFLLFLVYGSLLVLGSVFPKMNFYVRSLTRGPAEYGVVAFTFDDGPDPRVTPPLLTLLREHRIEAGFFVVGRDVETHPELLRAIDGGGHAVGVHAYQRSAGWALRPLREIQDELERTLGVVQSVLGRRPRLLRLPFGMTRPGLDRVLHALGLHCIAWDTRALEGFHPTPERIAAHLTREARNGSIILLPQRFEDASFHAEQVLETVRLTAEGLRGRGFRFVRLDILLDLHAYAEEEG